MTNAAAARAPGLSATPIARITPISVNDANRLLTRWGHYLGPANRPFRQEAFALQVNDEPVSVAISASIVSTRVEGFGRTNVVELARLCTRPGEAWATRVMLRLWRELAGPLFCGWEIRAAVAYSQNGRHDGAIYRFDGWRRVAGDRGSGGGGTWTRRRQATDAAYGEKTLWLWKYPTP